MRSRGFTLLELIIVIAIIALLIGVLVPVVGRVAESGRSAKCLSNLRQMALAAHQYALQHRYYPPAVRYELDPDGLRTIAWDFEQDAAGNVTPGPLWEFTDSPTSVQQCPSCNCPSNFGADPYTGYNYNTTYVGGEAPQSVPGWSAFRRGVRFSACRHPATTAAFGDGGYAGGTNKFMRAPSNEVENDLWTIYAGAQAFRHAGLTNIAYLDGHTESARYAHKGMHATDAMLETMDYPANGFLADDDGPYDPR